MHTGQVHDNQASNWPWDLTHQDMVWAIDKLQDSNASLREKRMASTIMQAWLGQTRNMRVYHQENASNIPVDS